MSFCYDIIVVGAGHAGCEAACAAASMGAKTVLITMDMTKIAGMSCNPAMGGVAKGQIIREIDALGGVAGIITDRSMLQFRMLNRSKGPAMWSPRAQCDRMLFTKEWRLHIERSGNIAIWQEHVEKLIIERGTVKGVITSLGTVFKGGAVILTNGTFLKGLIHVGMSSVAGGRAGEGSSEGLSGQLEALGLTVSRMKTGTSARVDGRSIDFSAMTEQKGDGEGRTFSFLDDDVYIKDERSCWLTHTNKEVHDEIRRGLAYSPLFQGKIKGIGPRYCPSIEDKVVTFKEKNEHQIFIEPEGWDTNEYYINGFASSLPLEFQIRALRKIAGLENIVIYRPGYAIEYDFFQPTQLKHSLETRKIKHLFFAGQINGTTGYEEAAAQGIIAGINAVLQTGGGDPYIPGRNESYIGVLIDDLVTKGVDEPYRMFTSRAEYRILLRQDNADERLTEKGYSLGLASATRINRFRNKRDSVDRVLAWLKSTSIEPAEVNVFLTSAGTAPVSQKVKLNTLVSRPQVSLNDLLEFMKRKSGIVILDSVQATREIIESAEIRIKYSGYIEREKNIADKIHRLDALEIPSDIEYEMLTSISTEARQKLSRIRPATIGHASRISGVSPSDISILLLYMGR